MSAVPEIGPASGPQPEPVPGAGAQRGLRRRPLGASLVVGGVLVALIVLMALVSYVWTPWDPTFVNAADRLQGFSSRHWLGTDKFGRDVFSQILMGARTTLFVGVVAVGMSAIIGVPLGIVAAMASRWTGEALMRGNDLLLAFPALLLAIMFSAIYGGSTLVAMVAIGIATVPSFVRLVRSGSLQVMRVGVRAGRPGRRAATVRHRPEARAAERRAPDHRAGVRGLRHRRARRGGAVVPRARHPAADPVVGPDAAGVARSCCSSRPGCASSPASRSPSPCSGSTCSATACATTSTRGLDDRR